MKRDAGFTFVEVVMVVALIGVISAFAIPAMNNALERNRVYTTAELIAAQVREARLAAITHNSTFRVRFNCFGGRAMRILAVTGDNSIDNAADRCDMTLPDDRPPVYRPPNVLFGGAAVLDIDGRGTVTSPNGPMPQAVGVGLPNGFIRIVQIWGSGRVRTPAS